MAMAEGDVPEVVGKKALLRGLDRPFLRTVVG